MGPDLTVYLVVTTKTMFICNQEISLNSHFNKHVGKDHNSVAFLKHEASK
jgi:hypothetical protein